MTGASTATTRPLIDIYPDGLSFELVPNTQPGCVLTVDNASAVTIAFKVKTTEPRRYLVRPNQGLVRPGVSESVNVYLIEKECNQFIRESAEEPSALARVGDKFLVQTVGLGDKEVDVLASIAANKQSEALTKIWATFNKTMIRNKKLSVKISLASGTGASAAATAGAPASAATQAAASTKAVGGVQSPARPSSAGGVPSASPISRTSPSGAAGTPSGGAYGAQNGVRGGVSRGPGSGGGLGGALDENSRVLANKYEDLVNYTANLTEERDELNTNLEEAKKALQREMATRIALESRGPITHGRKGSARSGVRPPASHQRGGGGGGFSLVTLSLVAASFFFLGHWLDLASAGAGGSGGGIQKTQHIPSAHDTVSKASPLEDRAESLLRPISGEETGGGSEL